MKSAISLARAVGIHEVVMISKPSIAVMIGSTRPGRYADKAAGWMLKQARTRKDIEVELLDLFDHPLPFFDEKGPLFSTPSENADALHWQKTHAGYDGFVLVVAEYNHSITGVLKNALDQTYKEWGRKLYHWLWRDRSVAGCRASPPHRNCAGNGLDSSFRPHWRRRFLVHLPHGREQAYRRDRGRTA